MPPDEANRDDDGGSTSPPHSQEWWAAVRRVVAKVLDAAEAAARSDARFRNDLARVFDAWPGGACAAEALDDARREASSPPAPDIGTEVQAAEVRASAPSAVVPALYPVPAPPAPYLR